LDQVVSSRSGHSRRVIGASSMSCTARIWPSPRHGWTRPGTGRAGSASRR